MLATYERRHLKELMTLRLYDIPAAKLSQGQPPRDGRWHFQFAAANALASAAGVRPGTPDDPVAAPLPFNSWLLKEPEHRHEQGSRSGICFLLQPVQSSIN